MKIVYARQEPPTRFSKALFLAGPTPRSGKTKSRVLSWRPDALAILQELAYDGVVFVPENEDGTFNNEFYNDQIEWEELCLNLADCIVFWVPRDSDTLPGFTTNIEWGVWAESGKVVFGAPHGAPKTRYLIYYATKFRVSVSETLEDTLKAALEMIEDGALRRGAECHIPLYIWRDPIFQGWYAKKGEWNQKLITARVKWYSRETYQGENVAFWVLEVEMMIERKRRRGIVISTSDMWIERFLDPQNSKNT